MVKVERYFGFGAANNATMEALPEIVDEALGLLKSLNTWK